MKFKHLMVVASVAWLCVLSHAAAATGSYPDKPVKLIVQGAIGSGPDVLARIVVEQLKLTWRQTIVIVNQPGAGGLVAAQAAANAERDGYTLFVPTITTFVILPEMQEKLPFDLDRDFVPIGLLAQTPMMIAVSPSLGVASVSELVDLSRKRPDGLFYAANNRGSLPHLTGELWRSEAGAPMTFVPYAGFTAGLQDLIGGRVSMIVESVGALAGAVTSGMVKPLAVASLARLPSHPEVPTVSETIPGFSAVGWVALTAPSSTPADVVQKISDDLNAALSDPGLVRRFESLGAIAQPMTPGRTQEFIHGEQQLWRPIVRRLGLKSQ